MKEIVIGEKALRIFVWVLIGLVILAAARGITKKLVDTAPEAPKIAPVKVIPTVLVEEVALDTEFIELETQGEVKAVRETKLAAEVGGKVIEVSPKFEAGEIFKEGELMLRIDPADYRSARANAEASLENARLQLEIELANGERARRDWEKLGKGQASDLVLRKPQLASAKAAVVSAEAALDKAMRDVERTEIRALYPCRLEETYIDLGATVGIGTALVDVMSLGPVEVRLPLSLEDYGYVQFDADGEVQGEVVATAQLGGKTHEWKGALIRSEGFVESSTRSVNVIAQFGRGEESAPPVGMFVDARLAGIELKEVIVLPRLALVDPTRVLVVTDESTVEFREVKVVRTSQESVVVSEGLKPGERVCVTALNAPVNGMEVLVAGEDDDSEEKPEEEKGEV